MPNIQLLYVANIISLKRKAAQQKLTFLMQVENLGLNKQVEIVWAGEDGVWQTLAARFHSNRGGSQELWFAEFNQTLTAKKALPGTIQFSLRYRVARIEYWDNNQGWNYVSEADSGIKVVGDNPVLNIGFADRLTDAQKSIPITVAANQSLATKKVIIYWTTDNWLHSYKTPCFLKKDHWQKSTSSTAPNPNQFGIQIWTGSIKIRDAFRVQYCISCEGKEQTLWDNNGGHNYVISRKPLAVMILNLHCYQEDNQDYKLSQIAKAINEREADIVCLQEVAEHWNDGAGDWESNSAKIINDRLRKPYHIYTDWSHLGFDKYREGVAILSRLPLTGQESRYVSESHDAYSIHSRKVVMAQIQLPYLGLINLFSAHLSWIEDGFKEQFNRLSEWAESKQNDHVKATLLCGDFNIAAGSEGYSLVVDAHQYDDQFLAANSPGVFDKIFKVNDPHWQDYLADDYRIDFIFMHKASELAVKSGAVLFTDDDYGRVSDHCGYLMTFEPRR
ncbi:MAG: endonuclease/exonuclease/phosphatase family protein [Methyloglobulus sp.]|nr:endonuclease [Methyloglobulus sp.]